MGLRWSAGRRSEQCNAPPGVVACNGGEAQGVPQVGRDERAWRRAKTPEMVWGGGAVEVRGLTPLPHNVTVFVARAQGTQCTSMLDCWVELEYGTTAVSVGARHTHIHIHTFHTPDEPESRRNTAIRQSMWAIHIMNK